MLTTSDSRDLQSSSMTDMSNPAVSSPESSGGTFAGLKIPEDQVVKIPDTRAVVDLEGFKFYQFEVDLLKQGNVMTDFTEGLRKYKATPFRQDGFVLKFPESDPRFAIFNGMKVYLYKTVGFISLLMNVQHEIGHQVLSDILDHEDPDFVMYADFKKVGCPLVTVNSLDGYIYIGTFSNLKVNNDRVPGTVREGDRPMRYFDLLKSLYDLSRLRNNVTYYFRLVDNRYNSYCGQSYGSQHLDFIGARDLSKFTLDDSSTHVLDFDVDRLQRNRSMLCHGALKMVSRNKDFINPLELYLKDGRIVHWYSEKYLELVRIRTGDPTSTVHSYVKIVDGKPDIEGCLMYFLENREKIFPGRTMTESQAKDLFYTTLSDRDSKTVKV